MRIKGISNIKYFAQGARGIIYTGTYLNKKVAIKTKNPESKAIERIKNEIKFLEILNKKNIGPKLLLKNDNYFVYEFQEGTYFDHWIKNKDKKQFKKTVIKLLKQCFIMDKLMIDKKEMLRPYRNVIIKKYNVPILIDFERCNYTKKPKNVTQLVQFMMNKKLVDKKVIKLLKDYKINVSDEKFNLILKYLVD